MRREDFKWIGYLLMLIGFSALLGQAIRLKAQAYQYPKPKQTWTITQTPAGIDQDVTTPPKAKVYRTEGGGCVELLADGSIKIVGNLGGCPSAPLMHATTDGRIEIDQGSTVVPFQNGTASSFRKPLNNQCPVCGEMAEPFRREGGKIVSGWIGKLGETINLTRCKRCNAAFWQDVEK